MVVAGHFVPVIRNNVFAVGEMTLSRIAGALYAWFARGTLKSGLIGGAVAGGIGAIIGIALSVALSDVPPGILIFGTLSSAVTGLAGAAISRWLTQRQTGASASQSHPAQRT
jgi:uncharacterized membrane protein YeaQ/YmgE (transglycosylase-associated protein family)